MKIKTCGPVLVMACFAWISACDSGSAKNGAADADSYQYKGANDPLLATSGADRAVGLADRFDQVQGRQ